MDDNIIANLNLDNDQICELKIAISKSSIEDCLDAYEEYKKSSINLDNKQVQACMFFCICVELETLDKRLDDIQLVFKDPVKVYNSAFLKEYFEQMQNEYWFTDNQGVFKAFSRHGFHGVDEIKIQEGRNISTNIITENFDDITMKEDEQWPESLSLPALIKLLEDNKQGIQNRKEMLKINEKALELLSLLRSEIFNQSNFVMRSQDSMKAIEGEIAEEQSDEQKAATLAKKHTLYKDLDYTSHSMINFSTTCDFNSNNLVNISSIVESPKSLKTKNLYHKAIISHILRFNMINNQRMQYDKSLNKACFTENIVGIKQDLIKFDTPDSVQSCKYLDQGVLSENHIKMSRAKPVKPAKSSSGTNSRNSSLVELNTSNSSSNNNSTTNRGNKHSVYKSFGNNDREPFSEKDISMIRPNKQVEESKLDNSFEDLMKCDFSKNLNKQRQQTEQNINNTLFNISNVSHRSRLDAYPTDKNTKLMNMDDNVDFNSINIGRSLNMAKRKDSPPSRKIIIAQNKVGSNINEKNLDIKRKTMTNIKSSTNDHLNKIQNLTKDKKINDENMINMKQPKPIKYNLGNNELLSTNRKKTSANNLNPDSNRESSIERSLSKTKSSFKNLVSPRTAASKLVRATDSNLDLQNISNNQHSSNSLTKTLSKDLSRDKISIIKPKEESVPVKLFKKNFSKQDEKFQILSDQLIDRVNMGRKKPMTLSSDRHFGSTKTTFTTQSAKNLQATAVVKKDTNNLIRTSTEVNFRIKTSKLPELALLSSRDSKIKKEIDIKNKNVLNKDKN